jgi:hypothetical protein
MTQPNEDLEAIYGPAAPYSEHKRGEHITYTTAEGTRGSGTIVWVQAAFQDIGIKYVVAPDVPTGFVDFVLPADAITVTQEQEPASDELTRCPYCHQMHPSNQVEACPLNPNKS